jgi:hypothetical protein
MKFMELTKQITKMVSILQDDIIDLEIGGEFDKM